MTFFQVNSPFKIFNDSDGNSLEGGMIFIGEANKNPMTAPVAVYWDSDYNYPAAQPIRTVAGYPSRNGTPANIYVNPTEHADYSISVFDKNESLVFSLISGNSCSQLLLDNGLNVKLFGAKGDGINDDYQAFATALSFMDSSGYKVLYCPKGEYLLSQTLILSKHGITIKGDGIINTVTVTSPTQLIATHSSGPVIRIQKENCRIQDLMVGASSARNSGAAGYNFGIQAEGEDTTTGAVRGTIIDRVRIVDQPNTGMLFVGEIVSSVVKNCSFDQNAGHGIAINRGETSGRTNQNSPPGIITVDNIRCNRNGGHGLAAGHPSAISLPSYRVFIREYEGFQNATDAAIRYQNYDTYFHCDNGYIITSAFGGNFVAGGVYLNGRTVKVVDCRYIKTTQPVEVGYLSASLPTRDVTIDGVEVRDTGPFNPAIIVDSNAINVKAISSSTTQITSLMDHTDSSGGYLFNKDSIKFNGEIIANTFKADTSLFTYHKTFERTNILDDDVFIYDTGAEFNGAILIFSANVSTSPSGMVFLRGTTGTPTTQSAIITVTNPSIFAVTTGALTGTTGTNGNLTISVDSSGIIYIENRLGTDRTYSGLLIG